MPKARKKTPGSCVFCDKTGLTKEHIWSDWLSVILPSTPTHSQFTIHETPDHSTKTIYLQPYFKGRQGSLIQKKIRNVCGRCNNGWMSELVSSAKPFAEQMIQDKPIQLDINAQTKLAAWISVTSVMGEFTDIKSAGIPIGDRKEILANKHPPGTWIISLGRYSGKNWSPVRYRHHGMKFIFSSSKTKPTLESSTVHYYHITNQVLGGLFFNAFSSTSYEVVLMYKNFLIGKNLFQLWPIAHDHLDWPFGVILEDAFVDAFADAFYHSFPRFLDAS